MEHPVYILWFRSTTSTVESAISLFPLTVAAVAAAATTAAAAAAAAATAAAATAAAAAAAAATEFVSCEMTRDNDGQTKQQAFRGVMRFTRGEENLDNGFVG
jgi:hypothetical protein